MRACVRACACDDSQCVCVCVIEREKCTPTDLNLPYYDSVCVAVLPPQVVGILKKTRVRFVKRFKVKI